MSEGRKVIVGVTTENPQEERIGYGRDFMNMIGTAGLWASLGISEHDFEIGGAPSGLVRMLREKRGEIRLLLVLLADDIPATPGADGQENLANVVNLAASTKEGMTAIPTVVLMGETDDEEQLRRLAQEGAASQPERIHSLKAPFTVGTLRNVIARALGIEEKDFQAPGSHAQRIYDAAVLGLGG
ncbi:MAG: hypothetical protein V1908_00730 [Candidatus Peregrinibacteria bacterium]